MIPLKNIFSRSLCIEGAWVVGDSLGKHLHLSVEDTEVLAAIRSGSAKYRTRLGW